MRTPPYRTRPIFAFALPVALAAALSCVPGAFRAEVSQAGHYAADGAFAAATILLAVLAWDRHRATAARRPVYLAAGLAVLGASTVMFGVALPALGRSYADTSLASYAWLGAWVVAAACFAAAGAAPRRDPLAALRSPWAVLGVALGAAAVLLAVAGALEGALPRFPLRLLAADDLTPFELVTTGQAVLAAAAVVGLGLAAWWYERFPGDDARAGRVLTAMAMLIGAGLQVVMLARPSAYRPVIQPADGWALVFAGTMFAAVVGAGRQVAAGMRRENDAARDVTRTRAELASMVAHELRNPLMSIKGLAATGSRLYDTMSDAERREFFETIDAETARLKDIVAQTSTALKIDAGELRYSLRRESVSALVEEAVWEASVRAHPVLLDVEPDLVARCDRGRVMEMLANLIDNADKYSPPDGQIEVRAFRGDDGDVVVEVVDGGPGVPDDERGHVFEKFSRYRPPGYEQVQGAGLGLFISRAHVEAHGGSISLDSGPDGGTIVRFSLPGGDATP